MDAIARVPDLEQEPLPATRIDFSNLPELPRRAILKEVPSGTISIETGADGAYLRFDCDCLDALPYCKGQCCALIGTVVTEPEYENGITEVDFDEMGNAVIKRDSDGYCTYLDRSRRLCTVYGDRPNCCKAFHCTRGVGMRGWKLSNRVARQSNL